MSGYLLGECIKYPNITLICLPFTYQYYYFKLYLYCKHVCARMQTHTQTYLPLKGHGLDTPYVIY